MSIETNRSCWACHKPQEFTSYDQAIVGKSYPLCSRKCFTIFKMVFRDGALVSYDHAKGNKLIWQELKLNPLEKGKFSDLRAKK